MDIEQEALLNLFLASNHLKKKIDDVCGKYGITHPQYNVLRILKGAYPEGYPRCEIIPRMIDQAPDVTRIIDNLEKRQLIERIISEKDRRLSITRVTQQGLDLLLNMEGAFDDVLVNFRESLTEDEISKLSQICEKVY